MENSEQIHPAYEDLDIDDEAKTPEEISTAAEIAGVDLGSSDDREKKALMRMLTYAGKGDKDGKGDPKLYFNVLHKLKDFAVRTNNKNLLAQVEGKQKEFDPQFKRAEPSKVIRIVRPTASPEKPKEREKEKNVSYLDIESKSISTEREQLNTPSFLGKKLHFAPEEIQEINKLDHLSIKEKLGFGIENNSSEDSNPEEFLPKFIIDRMNEFCQMEDSLLTLVKEKYPEIQPKDDPKLALLELNDGRRIAVITGALKDWLEGQFRFMKNLIKEFDKLNTTKEYAKYFRENSGTFYIFLTSSFCPGLGSLPQQLSQKVGNSICVSIVSEKHINHDSYLNESSTLEYLSNEKIGTLTDIQKFNEQDIKNIFTSIEGIEDQQVKLKISENIKKILEYQYILDKEYRQPLIKFIEDNYQLKQYLPTRSLPCKDIVGEDWKNDGTQKLCGDLELRDNYFRPLTEEQKQKYHNKIAIIISPGMTYKGIVIKLPNIIRFAYH